jgi:hypothetical protein
MQKSFDELYCKIKIVARVILLYLTGSLSNPAISRHPADQLSVMTQWCTTGIQSSFANLLPVASQHLECESTTIVTPHNHSGLEQGLYGGRGQKVGELMGKHMRKRKIA